VAADQAAKVGDLALDGTFVSADDSLDDVLGVLADGHQSWVPVVANDRLAGILSTRDVVAAYRGALAANVRQVNTVGSTGSLLEAEISPGSVLAGKRVSETAWPRDSVLVSVMRGEKVIVPRGNVVLEAGDHLTVFTAPTAREALQSLLASRIAIQAEAS
jgi:CBS domain-containing protein